MAQPTSRSTTPVEPVDLTGVTLTGGDGAAWSSVVGNGAAIDQPIRPTVAAPSKPNAPNASTAVHTGASKPEVVLVPVQDLSTKPIPPALDGQLVRNYPAEAKRRGVSGRAVVRATIAPDGSVGNVVIATESDAGFGAACQRTLLGSRWSPPRDKQGRAVSTLIRYTCDFRVDS
jgi:TonB family protein